MSKWGDRMSNRGIKLIAVIACFYSIISLYAYQSGDDTTKKKSIYMSELITCKQEKFEKTYEYPFLVLLTDENKKEYTELNSIEQKKAYIEYFWKEHNPNPILNFNDYLHDFIRRYYYTKEHFSCPKPPYFDDRGKYYLKYGKPSYRYQEKSQIKNNKFFRTHGIRGFLANKLFYSGAGEWYVPLEYSVQSNETWVYNFKKGIGEKELIVHFVGEGSFFREVESIDEAIIFPRKDKLKFFYWGDMIKDRAAAIRSTTIFSLSDEIYGFEEDIRAVSTIGGLQSDIYDVNDPHHKLRQIRNKFKADMKSKKNYTPVSLSSPRKALPELTFKYDILQFKDQQGRTTLSINYFTPYSLNFLEDLEWPAPDTLSLEYTCLLEDQNLERLKYHNYSKRYSLQKISQLRFPYLIESSSISVPAQQGRITIQLKDQKTRKIGFVTRDISLRDFSTGELCISDIQFCREIKGSLYKDFYPLIQKRGISVTPYPYKNIKSTDQIFCYFEIYNIKTSGIENEYEVSIEVKTVKEKKGIFKKIGSIFSSSPENVISLQQTRVTEQNDSQELIGLDFSNLKPGDYILAIRVKEKNDQNPSAEVTRDLVIMK